MKPVRAAWALLFVFLSSLPAGCAGLWGARPEVDVSLVRLVPREVSPLEQVLEVSLRVRNLNNHPLTLTGMRFDLDLNGRPVLRGLSNDRREIPRLGSALVKAEGSTSTLGLLTQLLELNPDRPIRYRLKGVAFTDSVLLGSLPFESAGELDLRPPENRTR